VPSPPGSAPRTLAEECLTPQPACTKLVGCMTGPPSRLGAAQGDAVSSGRELATRHTLRERPRGLEACTSECANHLHGRPFLNPPPSASDISFSWNVRLASRSRARTAKTPAASTAPGDEPRAPGSRPATRTESMLTARATARSPNRGSTSSSGSPARLQTTPLRSPSSTPAPKPSRSPSASLERSTPAAPGGPAR
jgi:hypothetical protein